MSFTLTLPFVADATKDFVFAKEMQEIVSLALVAGKNCVLFGPGGHGKSTFLEAVLSRITEAKTHYQSFGEDMDESKLYGGINLNSLEDPGNKRIEYYPENSFLAADYAVFEEGFEAPGGVLLSLKDTLSAGCLRNGTQQYSMQTRVIFLPTNIQPGEIAALGNASQSLIERFPLQLNVKWNAYESNNYRQLFETKKVSSPVAKTPHSNILKLEKATAQVRVIPEVANLLAELLAKVSAQGYPISPRTALHAQDLLKAATVINDRLYTEIQDLLSLRYLFEPAIYTQLVLPQIQNEVAQEICTQVLADVEAKVAHLGRLAKNVSNKDTVGWVKLCKRGELLAEKLSKTPTPDSLQRDRDDLLSTIQKTSTHCYLQALKTVSV